MTAREAGMRLVIHTPGEGRPGAFEQDVAVLNIWCDMALANIELGSPEVAEAADGGWNLSMECSGLTSFPVRLITEENLGDWLGSHETELSILGTTPRPPRSGTGMCASGTARAAGS
jgi:hypothetical protein